MLLYLEILESFKSDLTQIILYSIQKSSYENEISISLWYRNYDTGQ